MLFFSFFGSSQSILALPAVDHGSSAAIESPSLSATDGQRSVMIELDAPPVAVIYAQANATAVSAASLAGMTQAHLRTVEDAQAAVAEQISAIGAPELFRVQRVYNGITVRASAAQIAALETLPGVKAVHPLIAKYPTNARSVPYTGAPSLWAGGLDGVKLRGEGMRIAVIDTGLDYLHTDFDGPGTVSAENDPTIIGDVPNFPGVKVSAGYDFAGENYDADPDNGTYQPIPEPDPDPMDCYAHGTHVTGTVAGYGVDWDGATYTGPYDIPLDFTQFKIGPGMAPLAEIYALKIFGCYGSTELTELAIEWAVDPNGDGDLSDHVDVINMSLGSAFGSAYDTSAVASDRAALAGVIVVASAGNSGDTYFVTGSPAVADRAISVAAVSLPASPRPGAEADLVSFSARGPRTPDSALKPDIAAPGRSINSAWSGTGDGGVRSSGTSMAAPHIAGAAALLRQAYADWSVEEIKTLLMNSANFPVGESFMGTIPAAYGPTRTGAGVIDLSRAISTTLLAYTVDSPGAVSLSFGAPEVLTTITLTRTLRIVNKGAAKTVVSIDYAPLNDLPGATIEVAITSPITLAAGWHMDVPVVMTAVAADLKHMRDPTNAEVQSLPRHWLAEETGFVLVTPITGDNPPDTNQPIGQVRVPLHGAPRPVAELSAAGPLSFNDEMQGTIVLTGTGISGENPPIDIVSMVSAFELAYTRPNAPAPSTGDITDPLAYGDLRHVGVTSDYLQNASLEEATLYFGIATVENWSSPSRLRVNIYVDVDGDEEDDFRLFNSNENGYFPNGQFNDAFVTVVEDLATGQFSRRQLINVVSAMAFDTAIYNNRVMIMPVRTADIGLTGEAGQFYYRVETEVTEEENEVRDQTPLLVYDARRPGLDFFSDNPTAPLIEAEHGTEITIRLDSENYIANRSNGLLLLHHHNHTGAQAESVPMRLNLSEHLYVPTVIIRE